MAVDIIIEKKDEVFLKIKCSRSILIELSEHFTFFAKDYKFHPKYKARAWDGKIRLINLKSQELYIGLLDELIEQITYFSYSYSLSNFENSSFDRQFSLEKIQKNLSLQLRSYQQSAIEKAISQKRILILSPTGSGKSLIMYGIFLGINSKKKTLIIVPTTNLVRQLTSDFVSYGCNPEDIHMIMAGKDKKSEKSKIFISTWQSVYNLEDSWFQQFEVLFGDEVHGFKANSLVQLMTKTTSIPYKIGLTGSLDESNTNLLTLKGLFGPHFSAATSKELQDKKQLSKNNINVIVLKHNEQDKKENSGISYQDEIDFIIKNKARNKFIKNLALSLKGNSLILFSRVEDHGIPLYESIKEKSANPVYYVSGMTDSLERDEIRKKIEKENNAIIVASLKTFSTGIDMKKLHNIIFAHPTKSLVTVKQSLGRGLRLHENKSLCSVYDICDDLSYKNAKNTTLKHAIERIKIYSKEQFPYKIYNISL